MNRLDTVLVELKAVCYMLRFFPLAVRTVEANFANSVREHASFMNGCINSCSDSARLLGCRSDEAINT